MEFLFFDWLGKPVWMWLGFHALVAVLLAFDLGVLQKFMGNNSAGAMTVRESLLLSLFYVSLGLAFGGWVWWAVSPQSGLEYLTGFVIEKSLSMDNVFVIAMIFGYFAIPLRSQYRVLFWGILAVIVLRGLMIGIGAALVESYGWVLYLFAAFPCVHRRQNAVHQRRALRCREQRDLQASAQTLPHDQRAARRKLLRAPA